MMQCAKVSNLESSTWNVPWNLQVKNTFSPLVLLIRFRVRNLTYIIQIAAYSSSLEKQLLLWAKKRKLRYSTCTSNCSLSVTWSLYYVRGRQWTMKVNTEMNNRFRVATAQGKRGIWFLLFPDRENTGNFALTQGKILRHRENIFLRHREKFRHRENIWLWLLK